jgi:small-conductance mechanosensitive channel
MITQITSEATTWLGYLQRGSVLIQVGLFVAAISCESRVKRKLNSPLIASLTHLIVPAALFISASVLTLVGITAGFLQYLALLWVLWRCVEPTKQLIHQRFPKVPVEEIDKSFFRPVLLVMSILTFVQMLGSRESLSLISLGDLFGVTLTIGKLFTALVIVYMVIALASRPAAFAAWLGGSFFGIRPQGRKALEVILRYSVIGVGVMGVAYYIGINGTALVAVAGGLSVGIGFGIKEIISNFISSLWLLFEGSVRPGEILMINGDPCTVRKLGLRATQLRRGRDGAELLIPNQNFFTQEAESYTAEETSRRDAVVVGAAYHHEPSQVIAVLEEVARQHGGCWSTHHHRRSRWISPIHRSTTSCSSGCAIPWKPSLLAVICVKRSGRRSTRTASAFPSRSDRFIQWNGPPPKNKPTGLAAPPSSSRQKQTAIQPTIQLARRRR